MLDFGQDEDTGCLYMVMELLQGRSLAEWLSTGEAIGLRQILVMVDMTEQRELEERLQRQDRLSDMGEMAAQLAHQVRTSYCHVTSVMQHILVVW